MPDFDTRKPREANEPEGFRMTLVASSLSRLLSASKLRIQSVADAVRRSPVTNRLLAPWLGAVLLFVIAAASVGLIISSYGGFVHQQQERMPGDDTREPAPRLAREIRRQ